MRSYSDTTIAAPASGYGGAISVIRLSGPDTFKIVSEVFTPASDKVVISESAGYTVHYGFFTEGAEQVDDVIVTLYRNPESYTGEDAAEISCHASPYVEQRILGVLVTHGAVIAMPGEFTMRAFMNGKMDLSQAEAVADLIAADSEASHRLALTQLRGGLSGEIEKLRQELISFASLIELELDFSEEDVEFADRTLMTETIIRIRDLVDSLITSFRLGNAIKRGIPVVITGKPNAGKSSLLNNLLKEERALVSDIPGTTRDTIEELIHISGLTFRFIDTAGLRKSAERDIIETMGIERTVSMLESADIVIAVSEATEEPAEICRFVSEIGSILKGREIKVIHIINKCDLVTGRDIEKLRSSLGELCVSDTIVISVKLSEGIELLREKLVSSVDTRKLSSPQYIVTNERHYHALKSVSACLGRALSGFAEGVPTELIATDIRQAIYYLGLITGRITPDDILGEIFSNFCIGK